MTHLGETTTPGLARRPSAAAARSRSSRSRGDDGQTPALEARSGGLAERVAHALPVRHPVAVFAVILVAGVLALAGLAMLLGLLVNHVLGTRAVLGGADNGFVRTLSHHRTGTLDTVSAVGSAVGGAPVLPILAGLIALGFAITRHWRIAAFAVFVLAAESATYRLTTLAIHRQRPSVPRLEDLPANASFPSGHTAASVAIYSGLVLLLTSRLTNTMHKTLLWTFAVLATTFVAMSRMYRGMHHPLDVAAGVLVGLGAIGVLLLACRAAGVAATARDAERRA